MPASGLLIIGTVSLILGIISEVIFSPVTPAIDNLGPLILCIGIGALSGILFQKKQIIGIIAVILSGIFGLITVILHAMSLLPVFLVCGMFFYARAGMIVASEM